MERETKLHREELEKDLTARELALNEKGAELNQLRERAGASSAELAAAVEKAVKETADRLTRESDAREALLRKGFEGEQKVLQSRIESLQRTATTQT